MKQSKFSHETVEKKVSWLGVWIVVVISIGGLVEIVPLYLSNEVTTPAPGVKPYHALALEGRDIYIREGCYNCHSQMIRPLRAETERYGHYSLAGESVYDHPFQFGSKRTGPDLARVGGRYSDEWHRAHLANPRDVVPESNMPAYAWLAEDHVDEGGTARQDARAAHDRRAVHRRGHRRGRGRRARQDRDGSPDRLSTGPRHGLGELVSHGPSSDDIGHVSRNRHRRAAGAVHLAGRSGPGARRAARTSRPRRACRSMRRVRSRDHRAQHFHHRPHASRTSRAACGCCGGRAARHGEGATTDHTTGHVWDEDLRELNNPLPRWWLWLFIITVVFGGVYLVLYPGLGTFKGTLNWTSRTEHETQSRAQCGAHRTHAGAVQRARRRRTHCATRLRSTSAATCFSTTAPPATAPMAVARRASPTSLTRTGCGAAMPTPCVATISNGRTGVMPPWGEVLGARGVEDMLSYVLSLQRSQARGRRRARRWREVRRAVRCLPWRRRARQPGAGRAQSHRWIWLHGGSLAAVRDSIEKGRKGAMPAHAARLGETRVKLLAAYVLSLGRQEQQAVASAGNADEHADR